MKFNFNSNIWGPKGWFFIDTIILSYPNNPTSNDKQIYKNFLYQLKDILPCESCRQHYSLNIKEIPLSSYYLSSRNNLIEWIIKIHNKVNILKNKKLINKNEFIEYYKNAYNCDIDLYENNINNINNNKNNENKILDNKYITLILILVIIIIYLIYKKN